MGVLLAAVVAVVLLGITGCTDAPIEQACGWDTSTPEGQRAMTERLDLVSNWIVDNPGEPPPPIDSPYWLGECPTSTEGPPIHEDEGHGHEHEGEGHDHEDESPGP